MLSRSFLLSLLALIVPAGCNSGGQGGPAGLEASLRTEVSRKDWTYPYGTGVVLTTAHYRIFTSVKNNALLGVLPGFLEASYLNYTELTGLPPRKLDKRMDVYVLASRREWADLTRHIFGAEAAPLAIQAGGYSYKGIGVYWNLRRRTTLSVAAHEGLHQFLHHRMRHRLPVFLEEGLASSSESFHLRADSVVFPRRNPSRFDALRTAIIQKRWFPVTELMGMDGRDVIGGTSERALGWYAQVWALAQFLRTDPAYRDGYRRMLLDGEAGRFHLALKLPPQALDRLKRRSRTYNRIVAKPLFQHYISKDLETFERQYVAFARKLADL